MQAKGKPKLAAVAPVTLALLVAAIGAFLVQGANRPQAALRAAGATATGVAKRRHLALAHRGSDLGATSAIAVAPPVANAGPAASAASTPARPGGTVPASPTASGTYLAGTGGGHHLDRSHSSLELPPGVAEGVTPVLPPAPAGWSITARYLAWDGLDRYYLVARPSAPLPAGSRLPVLVVLHGHGMTPAAMEETARFLAVVGQAVVVYPAGYYASWNAGYCCGAAARAGIDDVGFLQAVVRQVLQTQSGTVAGRVYLAGYSNGGRMAYRLACEASGLFAGVAAVEAVPVYACRSTDPVPLLMVASTGDPLITVGDAAPPKHIDGQAEMTVQDAVDTWRHLDGCSQAAGSTTSGPMTVTQWDACAPGGRVELALLHGGTHAWIQGGTGVPSDEQLIWSFFNGERAA